MPRNVRLRKRIHCPSADGPLVHGRPARESEFELIDRKHDRSLRAERPHSGCAASRSEALGPQRTVCIVIGQCSPTGEDQQGSCSCSSPGVVTCTARTARAKMWASQLMTLPRQRIGATPDKNPRRRTTLRVFMLELAQQRHRELSGLALRALLRNQLISLNSNPAGCRELTREPSDECCPERTRMDPGIQMFSCAHTAFASGRAHSTDTSLQRSSGRWLLHFSSHPRWHAACDVPAAHLRATAQAGARAHSRAP